MRRRARVPTTRARQPAHNQPTNNNGGGRRLPSERENSHGNRNRRTPRHHRCLVGSPAHLETEEVSTTTTTSPHGARRGYGTTMPPRPNVRTGLDHIFRRMANESPMRRLMTATMVHEQLLDVQAEVAVVKRAAVRELRESGRTLASIGNELGITPSRVKQIELGDRKRNGNGGER